jgi:hypothetical protein
MTDAKAMTSHKRLSGWLAGRIRSNQAGHVAGSPNHH